MTESIGHHTTGHQLELIRKKIDENHLLGQRMVFFRDLLLNTGQPSSVLIVRLKTLNPAWIALSSIFFQISDIPMYNVHFIISWLTSNSRCLILTHCTWYQYMTNSPSSRIHTLIFCITNTLRARWNGGHFTDDVFKCIFLNENAWISIKISLMFVHWRPNNNIPAFV